MKELYTEPAVSFTLLAARERLAAEPDFDNMMGSADKGVSADPDLDIDIPLG